MSVRVVFADLDGTLLNKSHTVSTFTRAVLQRLRVERPAVKFVVATGRPYQDVMESMQLLDLHPDYIISNNGAVVHRGETHERVCQHTLSPVVVRELLAFPLPTSTTTTATSAVGEGSASAPSSLAPSESPSGSTTQPVPLVAANLYREDDWLATYKVPGLGKAYRQSFQPRIVPDLPLLEDLHQQVYSLFFYGPREHLVPLQQRLQVGYTATTTFSFSLPFILDVAPPAVDKGTAVRDVLALLDLTVEDAAAFGDAMNDLPMLTAVRHGFVMANAFPELLAATPQMERVGFHEEDGVAKKLLELFFPA